jgi:putative peptidoglycan lipid II flippase
MAWQLWRGTEGMGEAAATDDRLRSRALRMLGASMVMGMVLLALTRVLAGALVAPGLRYLALTALVAAGMAAYALSALALGAVRMSDLRSAVRRRG